jgi:hypothetical protein
MAADTARGSSPILLVGDRVVPHSAYRPTPWAELSDTPAWWGSLALLGGLVALAGTTVGVSAGEATAIGGVLLFFATAVVAGAERTEAATALAVAGLVWTSAGISLATGADGAPTETLYAFVGVGIAVAALGIAGAIRSLRRGRRAL